MCCVAGGIYGQMYIVFQRTHVITTMFVTKDFTVNSNLLL